MRRKNAAVLMTAVIIGGLLTSCGSAYNNANGKNSDNTVETQTTVRTVVNGETKTDGNNVKTADKETGDFTQEVTSEENNLTDNDIASNTEASEQQAFDDLSQAGGYENNSGQESWEDSDSGDDYQNSDGESYGDGDSSDNSEETDIPSASEDVMKSWLGSAGHKANILSPEYTKMGLGYSNSGCGAGEYSYYWAQEFAG